MALLVVATASAAGCNAEDGMATDTVRQAAGNEVDEAGDRRELATVLGDDRVGRALARDPSMVPRSFSELEALLGVGRQCAREDSKEIFVVEERSSRATGDSVATEQLLPRAVVTGCNTDSQSVGSQRHSFDLMAALVSSPRAPGAAAGDPMVLEPVEVMALDDTTGLYNFYVFDRGATGKPGTVSRITRAADGRVFLQQKVPGFRATRTESETRRCFSCHVNGGPLMNELTDPWTSWVSTRKALPVASVVGETLSIVTEAKALAGEHRRSSLANDLEQTMRAGMRLWVEGLPGVAGSGFGPSAVAGGQPDGMMGLVKSVFCQTELNYKGAFDTVPFELFVDPDAIAGAGLLQPVTAGGYAPTLIPVRSEFDKRIEMYLQKSGVLTRETALAVRLVDDEHDVFSSARCGLYDALLAAPPIDNAHTEDAIRAVLATFVGPATESESASRAYVRALIDTTRPVDVATRSAARATYLRDVGARFAADAAKVRTAVGRDDLRLRVTARQNAAKAMFPAPANPLPVIE